MRIRSSAAWGVALIVVASAIFATATAAPKSVLAVGVGGATWTPAASATTPRSSRFLLAGDSITYENVSTWSRAQIDGLQRYVADGLRYTHEINDRSGRLSATGYWATNHPDPAFDRDDDDADGRWEEAEITAGTEAPRAGVEYRSLIQFSRWRGRQKRNRCEWAWDRRLGSMDVLSQLSRDLLGEWQTERFTRTFERLAYPRVGLMPALPASVIDAECQARGPLDPSHGGVVVTFAKPVAWKEFLAFPEGAGRWTAFEAIGNSDRAPGTWTCGGPVQANAGLRACRSMDVDPDGVVAAVGYFDASTIDALGRDASVARIDGLRDTLTGLLSDLGGFGIQPPDLTVNDAYWELFLSSRCGNRASMRTCQHDHISPIPRGDDMAQTRRAEATWSGDLGSGGGAISAVSSGIFADQAITWHARTEAAEGKTSPEELLAAAHASCYSMALSHGLAQAGHAAERVDVSVEVSADKTDAGWTVLSSAITVRASVPGIDAAAFAEAADAAKGGCPISRALSDLVEVTLDAVLAS